MAGCRLPFPWANLALLAFLALELVTGLVGLLGAGDPFRVVFWLHAVGAYAIVFLLLAKAFVVRHALRRRPGATAPRVVLALLAALLLAVLATGLVWITAGYRTVLGASVVNLHAYLALALVALLVWHAVDRRWIVHVPAARDRAAFLRVAGVAVAGLALWQVERAVQELLGTPGSRRRFTGSYERGSFTGAFPSVVWLDDDPAPIEPSGWALVVDGAVERPLRLGYDAVLAHAGAEAVATLDCTGGWFTRQRWRGVALDALLAEAGLAAGADSVSVESATGFGRRFPLDEAGRLVLATHVAGLPLTHGHGFPVRLVAPDRRGFDWVKWVTRIRVLRSSHLLQPPLPLT